MKYINGALIIGLIILLVCITGCTSTTPSISQITPPPSAQPVTSSQTVAQLVSQTTPVSTISLPTEKQNITPNTTTQLVTEENSVIQESKPWVNNLQFRKNYFYSYITNCPMQEIFPEIVKDPNYGLLQPVPKITAISAGEYNKFIRDFTEGKNENTKVIGIARCQGAVVTPYWNFVQISAQLIPTNPRPSNYTISLYVRSKGKIVAQLNTTELLVKDQMVTLTSYIPLKTEEMEIFDGVEITFNKLS